MPVKFKNLVSDEERVAESEPLITALYNSSNLHANARLGQDLGWRLAPEVVIEMRRISQDPTQMQFIASKSQKPVDEVSMTDILFYYSSKTWGWSIARSWSVRPKRQALGV